VKRAKRLRVGPELIALILISVGPATAAQDMTVEWKATLSDLKPLARLAHRGSSKGRLERRRGMAAFLDRLDRHILCRAY
jgi:hypothetical protein